MKTRNIGIVGIVAIVFIFVGVCMGIGAFVAKYTMNNFMENAEEVDAVISDIYRDHEAYEHSSSVGSDNSTAYVTYRYDGKKYRDIPISYYSSSMRIGDDITVYVDPDDPEVAKTREGFSLVFIVFLILGGVFTGVGVTMICVSASTKRFNDRTKSTLCGTGIKTGGVVTEVCYDPANCVNAAHPIYIKARYIAPDGMTYFGCSHKILIDVRNYIAVGDVVDVWIDSKNYTRCYVDYQPLLNAKMNATNQYNF